MIYRPLIQPFKDKWRPNWTVAESMINDAMSLIEDQISLTLATPPPSPSHQSLFTLSMILEMHQVHEILRTPAAPEESSGQIKLDEVFDAYRFSPN